MTEIDWPAVVHELRQTSKTQFEFQSIQAKHGVSEAARMHEEIGILLSAIANALERGYKGDSSE